jgi:hypothetical protein
MIIMTAAKTVRPTAVLLGAVDAPDGGVLEPLAARCVDAMDSPRRIGTRGDPILLRVRPTTSFDWYEPPIRDHRDHSK